MSDFQPPPTWALPVSVDESSGKSVFNPIWLRWFLDLARNLDAAGTISVATNLAGGVAYQIPYQTAAATTSFYTGANYGVHIYGATGIPAAVAGAAGVLQGSASAIPAFTLTPTLTGTNITGIPAAGVTGTALVAAAIGTTVQAYDADLVTWAGITPGANVGTALAVAVGSSGAIVVNGGALGTPSSGTVTNLTGTASININGTVGATTPNTGSFTTVTASSILTTLGGATFHTTSSALTDGAGAGAGTLLNAPAAGNPTKWIGINDNGTTRYIPAW
tara:strand:- start:635 stop:1465 length:831 start_codon:yes stop_codon:yes gene_type:complete